MEAMKEVYLPVIATAIKVVAVIVWLPAGLLVVPVSIDQTGILGPPRLRGTRVTPDFKEFPAERTLEYRIRSGVLATNVLFLVAVALTPRAFLGRHRVLFRASLALSALPVLAVLYVLASETSNIHLPIGQSIGDMLEWHCREFSALRAHRLSVGMKGIMSLLLRHEGLASWGRIGIMFLAFLGRCH